MFYMRVSRLSKFSKNKMCHFECHGLMFLSKMHSENIDKIDKPIAENPNYGCADFLIKFL